MSVVRAFFHRVGGDIHFKAGGFLAVVICPFFGIKCIIGDFVLLAVVLKAVAPYKTRQTDHEPEQRSEQQTLPGVAVFVDARVICPQFFRMVLPYEDEQPQRDPAVFPRRLQTFLCGTLSFCR